MSAPHSNPSFGEALKVWARIGLLSFGGPGGQIALMHRELVEQRRWIPESRFLHALNYCMLLPGPEAQQLATYIGWLLHGTRGGVAAGLLFVLPGFLVILALSAAYALWGETGWLSSLFFGLKAAVLAIVVEALLRVGRRALRNGVALALAAAAFGALFLFAVPFPVVVILAGLIGFFGASRWQDLFGAKAAAAGEEDWRSERGMVTGGGWGRAVRVVAVWGALWIAPFAVLVPLWGWSNTFVAVANFFSQMAVVTFGGAYAVLSHVAVEAVETFGWLRPGEMLDGLALAETTPGPLVLVLSFVGFMAGFRAPGVEPLLGGVIGASLAAWVTFVPCFLWIFLGAPHVEGLRSNRALSGALAAITAAVVGVILNLALWFALHVLFREVGRLEAGPISVAVPDWATFDPTAAALSAVAGSMLFGLRQGVIPTLLVCGLLGLGLGAMGWAG